MLHVTDGPDAGRLFLLDADQVTIGRNAENTIVLNDTAVSGVHTKVVRDAAGQFTIHDMQSTNGTWLNGREHGATDLRDGDTIRIGSTSMVFELRHENRRIEGAGGDEGLVHAAQAGPPEQGSLLVLPEVDPALISAGELMRRYQRGLLLDRLDRALVEAEGTEEVLNVALEASLAVSRARRGVVLLIDARSGEMHPRATCSLDGDDAVTFSKSLAFDVATSGVTHAEELPAQGGRPGGPVLVVAIRTTSTTGGVIYLHGERPFGPEEAEAVESVARRAGTSLSASRWQVDFELLFSSTIDAIMNTIQAKDVYTRGHSERVRHYSKLLAKELGLTGNELYRVTLGAALHDIGKVGMPDSVLKFNKEARLTDEQMDEVKKHPARGARILGDITFLRDVIPAAELHHEDWDGGGYPHGLKGEEIPLIARIVAVADTYDAITTDRPYQKGKSYEEGHQILRKIAGKRLDPDLVESFIQAWKKYRKAPRRAAPETTRVDEEVVDSLRRSLTPGQNAGLETTVGVKPPEPPDVDDRLQQIIQIG
ncbi:MAG: HD domain-containing phosphohydrolase [Planctomycetota bacterium]